MYKRHWIKIALTAAMLVKATAHAADYPDKPIRLIVGFPAGGSTDVLSRQIVQVLAPALKQQIVVDNRAGATGNVASEITARANADGYTLMMATVATHAINPALYRKVAFDPVKDFAAVSLIASYPLLLAVNPNVAAKSVRELIDMARAKPGALRYSSSGSGSPGHLAAEIFKLGAKVDMQHVPYKGGSPAVVAVVAGECQLNFGTLPGMMPHAKANRLRALGVTTAARSPALPDVPTIAESGLQGYDVSSWAGMVVPAGTPKPVIAKLHREVVAALKQPTLSDRLSAEGAPPIGSTPEAFAQFIRDELTKWAAAVKQAGAQID